MHHAVPVEVKGPLLGVGFLLLFWVMGIEASVVRLIRQTLLSTEPSHQPRLISLQGLDDFVVDVVSYSEH